MSEADPDPADAPRRGVDLRVPLAVTVIALALAGALAPVLSEARRRNAALELHSLVVSEAKRIGHENKSLDAWIAARDFRSLRAVQTEAQASVTEALLRAGYKVSPQNVSMRLDGKRKTLNLYVEVPDTGAMFTVTTEGADIGRSPQPADFGLVLSERLAWVFSVLLVGLVLALLPWLYPALRRRVM